MARRQSFPNQSSADQFFDESQFESYHRLGLHIAKSAFGPGATGEIPDATKKIRARCWAEPDQRQAHGFWTEKTHAATGD
jgi:hypothetical protein